MTYFPLFTDLKNRDILIFGSGDFVIQRIGKLLPFSASITVIAPFISDKIKEIEGISFKEKAFSPSDLDVAPSFVITAENEETTSLIRSECRKKNIPVNAVDMPEYCDIIFPSVISTEHLCIGISSGGISPTATVEFKERFEQLIPDNIDEILEFMPVAKQIIKNITPEKYQKAVLREVFSAALNRKAPLSTSEIITLTEEYLASYQS